MKARLSAWLLLTFLIAGCAAIPKAVLDQVSPSAPSAAPGTFAGLTVDASPLGTELPDLEVPEGDKPPALRDKWQGREETRIAAINKTLAPFGYRVTFATGPDVIHRYAVYHGDTVVASEVDSVQSPSVNSRGDDFVMLVESRGQQLLRPGQAEPWDVARHALAGPVFAGDRIVAVWNESGEGYMPFSNPLRYSVRSGDEKLFSDQLQWARTDSAIKGLSGWDGHWVLEVGGRVLIDGKDLGAAKGYTEVFGWQLLAGKPFYYAVKDGQTSVVYDEQVFPTQYESVMHYGCCSAGAYDNGGNEQMAWFFGRKDGQWHYVEMGKYD